MSKVLYISSEDECMAIEPDEKGYYDIKKLIRAMIFKSEHIKAKADPELFKVVAGAMDALYEKVIEYRKELEWINHDRLHN